MTPNSYATNTPYKRVELEGQGSTLSIGKFVSQYLDYWINIFSPEILFPGFTHLFSLFN
jgi:hypothetical protein